MSASTYVLVKFSWADPPEVVARGLTLDEAQSFCQSEDSHERNANGDLAWFVGYDDASGWPER